MSDGDFQEQGTHRGLLARLGRTSFKHRRLVIGAWVVLLAGVAMLSSAAGTDYSDNFTLPGTESQQAYDLLTERFQAQQGDENTIVYRTREGTLERPAIRRRIETNLAQVRKLPHVAVVTSPYSKAGTGQISKDGRIGYATVLLDKQLQKLPDDVAKPLITTAQKIEGPGLQVELGGYAVQFADQSGPDSTEGIALVAAAIVLLITFGSLVAAGLPLFTALFGLGTGLSLVAVGSNVIEMPDWSTQLAAMVGLGVGIDYALFIATRFRAELRAGASQQEATVIAMDTAGRAVFFAGITVMIAMLGLLVLGLAPLRGVAIATSATVALVMTASLTLLPAFLRVVGRHINRLRLPFTNREPKNGSRWERWSKFIQRRPWPSALVALLVLLLLAFPAFSMRLASADAGNEAPDKTARQAYDLLSRGFGPGFNGPFLLVVELPAQNPEVKLEQIAKDLSGQEGVANVSPPRLNADGNTGVIQVQPTTSPQSRTTEDTLARLRDEVIPPIEQATGAQVYVGGNTAGNVDFSRVLADKLPFFIGVVVLLSFLLLMVVFRSLLVPIKAAVMNLLSIGAALGLVTAVFEDGIGASLIGVDSTGPIEAFLPVMMFAIVFGLSMDYEVFLLSRMHEEWLKKRDASEATAHGLAVTGRVITAAASIMVVVFASFILGNDRVIKLFGLGLASAVAIDAVIIRCLLVPAVMELLGKAAWWMPSWLSRLLPRVSLEPPEELERLGELETEPAKSHA